MTIGKLILGALQTNCYIFADEVTKEAVIIDPADNANYILEEINKNGYKIKIILLTHGHFDHISAVPRLKEELQVPVYAHEKEQVILENTDGNLSGSFSRQKIKLSADKLLSDGDTIVFGENIELKVIFTAGHTPGGVCYYFEKENILFSGDTLFLLSIGRTDFKYGDYQALITSIKDKLFLLPDETKVFPGHGDMTTISREKKENPFLTDAFWE